MFWHLYQYPSLAQAEAARAERGVVVESLGRVWVYTIADAEWKPASGERVAVVGPLPVTSGKQYTARYMEAVFGPGMQTASHTHSGPEAWYVIAGAQCLETPSGVIVAKAGEGAVVPEGPPMVLRGVGNDVRRSAVLVLHDPAQPWMTMEGGWTPPGRCPK
jgi:quercetin dioxygenase-like cupin family protein